MQAASNYFARMKGVGLMENGATPIEIISALGDSEHQPERQQYGIVILNPETRPLVHSGSEINDVDLSLRDQRFSRFIIRNTA